jgi:hypothetical protein
VGGESKFAEEEKRNEVMEHEDISQNAKAGKFVHL